MNPLVQLKGDFIEKANAQMVMPTYFDAKNTCITLLQLQHFQKELRALSQNEEQKNTIGGFLVSIHYDRIIPKSRRVTQYFSKGKISANSTVVGAKFGKKPDGTPYHIITHFVTEDVLNATIKRLKICIQFMQSINFDCIDNQMLDILYFSKKNRKGKEKKDTETLHKVPIAIVKARQPAYEKCLKNLGASKSMVGRMLVESANIVSFREPSYDVDISTNSVVTIYRTAEETVSLMRKLGIELPQERIVDDTTMLLYPEQLRTLQERAPYLISMAVSDLSELTLDDFDRVPGMIQISDPKDEPVVGVIDGPFETDCYCAKWVDYVPCFSSDEFRSPEVADHGTEVTSLIVDGPSFNPEYDDGCGRFRVKHFGVISGERVLSFTLLKQIRQIVESHPTIKVWNLSLGSLFPVSPNYISPVGALLDRLQSQYDVIFVVAGTNDPNETKKLAIGEPADSINSVVVNSVRRNGSIAAYTRFGPVLSFFRKPDVSYYGGDTGEELRGCTDFGEVRLKGTSFAAPWITRKMAYMIYKMHLPREIAKALLIDSASGWTAQSQDTNAIGFGVVPVSIQDIIQSRDDELKFFFYKKARSYDSMTSSIPVPRYEGKFPYVAKATMCYFPYCDRNQGVDYTNTELDIHFGRIDEKGKIHSVDDNQQAESGDYTNEEEARRLFRKWDNVKHIIEHTGPRKRAKKVYGNRQWALDVKLKERLGSRYPNGLSYGVVVTLRALDGKNRYNEFITLCMANNWLVVPLNVQQQIEIQQLAEEEVKWTQ